MFSPQLYLAECILLFSFFFFFNDPAPTEIYPLSLHDALPIYSPVLCGAHLREVPLSADHALVLAGDSEAALKIGDDLTAAFTRLVAEAGALFGARPRSEEHTSELQSRLHLVCRLLLEKKKMRSNVWASGYDVDGTDQTSLGQFSGRVQQTCKHSVPRFFVPEHGTMFTLALVRFPPTATKEIQYLNAKGALTYTDIAFFFLLYGHPPTPPLSPNAALCP